MVVIIKIGEASISFNLDVVDLDREVAPFIEDFVVVVMSLVDIACNFEEDNHIIIVAMGPHLA